ncbi:suppressor of fused domain protein [Amorphoplanes digitatis]|uniref:Suppressor of fused-like domain-containing protein n=1 Tax=Actinoplanes digitatis TaxID=1868 RepID=A0A7W7MTB4_9ACTN|nr:suppressor of fused domain protein [Actinoplanes digitatis]MBB4765605.1 hypothetical protein [Actinoplanes digitatis]BFE75468.1 hypothetical protein GCM10020092_087690 [Actinoplanes digitatis]
MADVIEHLESFLGHMSGGSRGDETTPEGVQLAWFPDSPFPGVTTPVTVDLSRRHLAMPNGGALHQELMMHVPKSDYPARAAGLLFQVAGEMVRRGSALQHAQVIGPHGPLFPGSQMTAMVAISPLYLPDASAFVRVEDSVPVVLTWLVPITDGEAEFSSEDPPRPSQPVGRPGWSAQSGRHNATAAATGVSAAESVSTRWGRHPYAAWTLAQRGGKFEP